MLEFLSWLADLHFSIYSISIQVNILLLRYIHTEKYLKILLQYSDIYDRVGTERVRVERDDMAKLRQKRVQQYDGSLKALFGEEAEASGHIACIAYCQQ